MEARELRIGNWVKNGKGYYQVADSLITLIERGIYDADPIPLTEEWFFEFGFEIDECKKQSNDHSVYYSMWIDDYKYSFAFATFRNDWGFYFSYTDAPNKEENNRFVLISHGIKYVHQLQNLIFALTQKELTIKEQ